MSEKTDQSENPVGCRKKIFFRLSRIKDNETVRQLRWLRTRAQTANARNSSLVPDIVMVLMVLMVPMVLKKLRRL